jgi:hypothetical protein
MKIFIAGLLTMGNAIAALFFARFWRETSDRLFGFFSAAFALLALQRALLAAAPALGISDLWSYLIRLAAFVLILLAIVDKNRR